MCNLRRLFPQLKLSLSLRFHFLQQMLHLRRHRRVVELDELSLERQESDSPNPRENLATRETASEILRFVDRLPANQREVIRLKLNPISNL